MAAGDTTVAFANRGLISIAGAASETGGPTPGTFYLAVIKDVELTVSADHVPLYGWGTIRRVAVAKHSEKVAVKIGSMKFNPSVALASPAWWSFVTFGPGATPSGTAVNTDTNRVKLFDITATYVFEDGQILKGTVYDVYFPNLPLRASEGQWVKLDMSGEGSYVLWANS